MYIERERWRKRKGDRYIERATERKRLREREREMNGE